MLKTGLFIEKSRYFQSFSEVLSFLQPDARFAGKRRSYFRPSLAWQRACSHLSDMPVACALSLLSTKFDRAISIYGAVRPGHRILHRRLFAKPERRTWKIRHEPLPCATNRHFYHCTFTAVDVDAQSRSSGAPSSRAGRTDRQDMFDRGSHR